MTQHTPEPWGLTRDTDTKGRSGWRIDSDRFSLMAWIADGTNDASNVVEIAANAKLMAAAPEMLAALEAFMHADELLNRDVEFERRFERAVILAKRALEKIEQ